MKYAPFPPLAREVSRLVLGTVAYRSIPAQAPIEVLDAWLELGGDVIDTGREYGESEGVLGRWVRARSCRDRLVLITKGAHPDEGGRPRLTPEAIESDLRESLATLETEVVEVFLLHRDDPATPVGPIIETLNEQVRAGRARAFGASNWTTARIEEANAYAADRALSGFTCASPELSLARPNQPRWPGCVTASDSASRKWYERTRLPVFAWSSQGGGFFSDGHLPGRADGDMERVYGSADNWERLRRAKELARRKGATPVQVALAWVLHLPFPVFPIIGPRSVAELESSVAALELSLTPEEHAWLDLAT